MSNKTPIIIINGFSFLGIMHQHYLLHVSLMLVLHTLEIMCCLLLACSDSIAGRNFTVHKSSEAFCSCADWFRAEYPNGPQ